MIWHGEHIGPELERLTQTCQKPIAWVSTQRVWALYGESLLKHAPGSVFFLADGEEAKSLTAAEALWKSWAKAGLHRGHLVIAFGGGALLDAAGFCASTYMRGLEFWYIPSSLLAMVDAAVGGKTGLNLGTLKNYIGTFHSAQHVLICPVFLKSLGSEELLSGWGEILKHALIQGEPLWSQTARWPASEAEWSSLLAQNSSLKQQIVESDFRESGKRKVLNAGHSVGHGLESLYRELGQSLPHGVAVAHGLAIETLVAYRMNVISREQGQAITTRIDQFFSRLSWDHSHTLRLFSLLNQDKKNDSQGWQFSLARQIGDVGYNDLVSPNTLSWALTQYLNLPG